jgi:dethiobiotin synthetase
MTDTATRRLAITGTDTGVGKTVVSCVLAALARHRGIRVKAMKPLETGIDERPVSFSGLASDAERLRAACGGDDAMELVRPYALREPLAPMVAARRAGVSIEIPVLDAARDALSAHADLLLVEGAGGLLVPITPTYTFLDLFVRWQTPLLVVAGNRLGVLNHVLLTMRAAQSAGVPVQALVLTATTDRDPSLAEATNFDALQQLLPQTTILRFPWVDRFDDADALAVAAAAAGFDRLLTGIPVLHPASDTLAPSLDSDLS